MNQVDYEVLSKFTDYDKEDLEFYKVTNNINTINIDYGVEVIFDYYRRHGFPHYSITEQEKHQPI